MRWFYAQIFACIDEVYAQTYQDKERLESLGAKRVEVTGNIKLASLSKPNKAIPKPKGTIVCAASTHDGEEVLALQAFSSLSDQEPEAKLLIVPRHPERFAKVGSVIQKFASEHGWSYSRYSEDDKLDTKVVLVDKLGELVNIYTISDIVVLGGAFVPAGGHNAAEAAQFGCKIISGEHYFNQKDIFDAVDGIKIVQEHELDWWLLEHQTLPNTSLRMRSDITPIVESINHVLSH
jgi:3-deoxy-D-manno-octulosonic-acid transferase